MSRSEGTKLTSAQAVQQRLAADILDGQFRPGAKLEEKMLAEHFGVSRTPVREALRLLAATGLVEHRPNRGVIVSLPDDAQLAEMFEVLGELERACARYAAMRMSPAEKSHLAALHRSSGRFVDAGDIDGYMPLNLAFHKMIYAGAHNAFLLQTTESTHARCAPFRQAQFRVPERLERSHAEHQAVVEAILAGRSDEAYRQMLAHVTVVRVASSDYVHIVEKTSAGDRKCGEAVNGPGLAAVHAPAPTQSS